MKFCQVLLRFRNKRFALTIVAIVEELVRKIKLCCTVRVSQAHLNRNPKFGHYIVMLACFGVSPFVSLVKQMLTCAFPDLFILLLIYMDQWFSLSSHNVSPTHFFGVWWHYLFPSTWSNTSGLLQLAFDDEY